ncbi:aldehyde dehydrogenase family protein [Nocardia arthritidis]|uniref:Aldehyde dehydrogenase family protein n=1 Tax=Nocardia arthritidis TaxID=228602 RepID=A0A6G9YLP7_9NOCA|nr:aldehyde dehydrogenase family protein [Nocardia arthritidis]QIS13997.1 aldehyde dehydrogenase family protein [Nocardia arthritidis]
MSAFTEFYINGQWRDTTYDGQVFETLNPATAKPIADVPQAGVPEVDEAVEAASTAFRKGWASPSERGVLLWRLADLVEANAQELAELESLDQGNRITDVRNFQISSVIANLRYFAGYATKVDGTTSPVSVPGRIFRTKREPIGVCGLMPAWNAPTMELCWKLAPALACGNTVVVRAPREAPLSILRFAQFVEKAGFPAGVVNILTGGAETGDRLAGHPDVRKISFTGSTRVGKHLLGLAASNLKRVTLELGGKDPVIIAADADIDAAVAGQLVGGYYNAGQHCSAFSRTYVHTTVLDEFRTKLTAAAEALRIGPGTAADTDMGPLISERAVERTAGYVERGIAAGATLVTGGYRVDGDGFFYAPTILADIDDTNIVAREEIFGPVVNLLTFTDEDEVIARANNSEMGLAASVWSRDIGFANRVAEKLEAGTVWVNSGPFLDAMTPWGGVKQSGWGHEMGHDAIQHYSEIKSITTAIA